MLDKLKNMFNIRTGEPDFIKHFEDHIIEHVGWPSLVVRPQAPGHNIDVHIIEPTHEMPFHTLVTAGMSDLPMHQPPTDRSTPYAELVMCLPPEWWFCQESMKNREFAWPVELLQSIAAMPHNDATFLGYYHTNSNDGRPFGPNTGLSAIMVMPPLECELKDLAVEGKTVKFMQVVLLYQDELNYAMLHGSEQLWTLMCNSFEHAGYPPEILYNVNRPSALSFAPQLEAAPRIDAVRQMMEKTMKASPQQTLAYIQENRIAGGNADFLVH